MPAVTKAQLVAALTALGETPPKSWNMPELKLRLSELQGDLLNETKPKKGHAAHRAMVIELNRAKKENKEHLRRHVGQVLKVPLTDNGPQPSGSNDQVLTMMQQLMNHVHQLSEEVQNIKEERPHKKEGKTVSEATAGSFELMQP